MQSIKKFLAGIFIFLGFYQTLCAQIGINQDNPSDSAVLHISSDSKGVLFPAPVKAKIRNYNKDGLFYYGYADKRFYFFNGNNWQCINPFNATDSSQITAPGNLTVDTNLTVGNNLTVKTNLSVNNIFEATNDNDKIEFKKDINANNHSITVNEATVSNNVTVKKGDVKIENGNVNVSSGEVTGRGTVPVGTIVMWNGNTIPNNWHICNGKEGTPDLTGKFVEGANSCDDTGGDKLIGHSTDIYTTEPDNCENYRYIYKFKTVNIRKNSNDTIGGIQNKEIKGNYKSDAEEIANCNHEDEFTKTYCYEWNIEKNENYYLHPDNKENCIKDGYAVLEKFKLVYIMRVE